MIPMVDLKRQYLGLKEEIDQAIADVLNGCQFILGPQVTQLEQEVAAYHGLPYAIGVANGTDALLLALRTLGIGRGDEVITTPFTFFATAEVIAQLGAIPVFADISLPTFNINPALIEKKITKRTRAIIPVHLFGHPAEMKEIMAIAKRYDLKVVEDCAQSFGALYHGARTGSIGHIGCFSFFPSKNLAGYGDGGMITTADEELAKKIRSLRNHGSERRYYHSDIGYNSRLDEIQAAIIRVKLKRIDQFNESRRLCAQLYREYIKRPDLGLPQELAGCTHVYHQFTLLSPGRDNLMRVLADHQCSSAIYYPIPLHLQEVFQTGAIGKEGLTISERCAARVVSLPIFPELKRQEIEMISHVINHAA